MKYWIDNKYYFEDNVDNAVIIQKCFDVVLIFLVFVILSH
jgi:hypothetical protein